MDKLASFEGDEEEMDVVDMHIQCHKCEGWGRVVRDRPPNGKGTGGKGSKGDPKVVTSAISRRAVVRDTRFPERRNRLPGKVLQVWTDWSQGGGVQSAPGK